MSGDRPGESFDLEAPEHFTAGAVGPPGQRVFYLQARQGSTLLTLKAEKEQVAALGEYLAKLLAQVGAAEEPAPAAGDLLEPIVPAWAIASLGLGYDEASRRILVIASELTDDEEEEGVDAPPQAPEKAQEQDAGASARILITRGQAGAFVERAKDLVAAGRPVCPACTRPMGPAGHICPRGNGHGTDPA